VDYDVDMQARGDKHVKNTSLLAVLTGCVTFGSVAHGQSAEAVASSVSAQAGVPIEQLVAIAAKKTGKKFILDPRVHANVVLIGGTPLDLSYSEFLAVLDVYGFGAVDDGKLVRIVPEA
jgi:type II secretory pathway component GspD/PulD (secretin)